MSEITPAIRETIRIACRGHSSLNEHDRRVVLTALIQVGEPAEAEAANDVLFFKQQADKAQFKLGSILNQTEARDGTEDRK